MREIYLFEDLKKLCHNITIKNFDVVLISERERTLLTLHLHYF